MINYTKRFTAIIVSIAVVSVLVTFATLKWGVPQHSVLIWPLISLAIVFAIISLVNGLILLGYVAKRPQLFIRAFMASMTIKFVLYIAVLSAYALNWRPGVVPIVIVFFSLFIIYTVVEKSVLFSAFRQGSE